MASTQLSQLIPVLQVSVGPVILISGAGLLLLSFTNRLGRAVDRTRDLLRHMRQTAGGDQAGIANQVNIIYQRARLIQASITLCATSVLLAAVMIITLFLSVLMQWESVLGIVVLFTCSLAALIASLVAFIMDIRLSLKALKLELNRK
jgi:hypothetical protein